MPRLSFFVFNILVATGPLWFTKYKGRTSFKTFRLFLIGFPSGSVSPARPVQWSQQSDFIKYFLSLPLPAGVLFTAQEAIFEDIHPTFQQQDTQWNTVLGESRSSCIAKQLHSLLSENSLNRSSMTEHHIFSQYHILSHMTDTWPGCKYCTR